MGTETSSTTGCSTSGSSSTTSSPSGKRSRDPEDDVYIDNLHSHKRYLSEIMASSLNGLTVGDPIPESLLESPARDEIPWQYSPMSEDSDDARFCDAPINTTTTTQSQAQPDSGPSSPVSPHRYQKPLNGFYSSAPSPYNCSLANIACPHQPQPQTQPQTQPRQRGADSEGRFPSSPSDICHSADLRRAALMRSVQIRTTQCPVHVSMESEERPCSYIKSLVNDEREEEYRLEDCASMGISDPECGSDDVKED